MAIQKRSALWLILGLQAFGATTAQAQTTFEKLKNLVAPKTDMVAKEAFGAAKQPANLQARVIGFYARGCLAGAQALPVSGETWQVMRLSRNRNWGHPNLIEFLERFAKQVPKVSNWNGIMVGDLAQPRGGPMLTGHASHQIGLDADIWLTPMPKRLLSREEREEMSAVTMLREDKKDIDPKVWTTGHTQVIKAAAKAPEVERIFVNAGIKKALCREAGPSDRSWLAKVRPYWGHHYHFHVRLRCPADSPGCEGQKPVAEGEGCADSDFAFWMKDSVLNPKPAPPGTPPAKPKPPMMVSQLPAECRQVVVAP
ncbi:penicillin-insensitive murein endopeptidase precursor [Variibacter gotjawalensis]|uniref:Penicillin-insensitive murein endopeptidase n=1 Tax=Variibacter gotjawalensis TaxID=1333996 RepID=A0A0S3Q0I1_9BRAD|nr:penicillin-insensitive murein endopeptidase [Variibacter gotjawalensis]NIK47524.1 penicillin-insensitive murein endopeptidase [Variibacter gotjawalensis]RZS49421.1 murein endopeptidase [Variibacter gotjawalensis]BAT61684.1 penicillin-insensitive murein endopeptidase precursor [Variibacter gotjawalensis]